MSVKTRYLQLSSTVMMEYCMKDKLRAKKYTNGEDNDTVINTSSASFIMTELNNGHYAIFSPASAEVEAIQEDNATQYKLKPKYVERGKNNEKRVETLNTICHLAVPQDANDSYWYTFLDNDYDYTNESNVGVEISASDIKIRPAEEIMHNGYTNPPGGYGKYCRNPFNKNVPFQPVKIRDIAYAPGWDTVKLYFVSGYDFSDMYGSLIRISIPRNDGKFLDLCNFFYTKSNAYKYVKFMTKPIIFGSFIYDKYIEINVPSLAGIEAAGELESVINDPQNDISYNNIKDLLNINPNSNIRLMFSYIDEENKELTYLEYTIDERINKNPNNKNVLCQFARTSTIKGSIPTQHIQSDNLGVYIAINPDYPYIEFYGTWKNMPLNYETVQSFNNVISLYDNSLIRRETTYTVDEDYEVKYDMRKWVVLHEIECLFLNTNREIVKEENYSLSQLFTSPENEITKFYYRPIFFDEHENYDLNELTIVLHYNMRLMNIEDSVQFLKKGSLTLTNENSDISRFWGKGAKLPFADTLSYKVYNKIVESKQVVANASNVLGPQTKYVKVFYNVSNITLSVNQGDMASGNYTLIISKAPRNYKFIFKQEDINGNKKYVDLTDSYYKLYAKDNNGNDIIIDPTYSANMNLMLGELEFNISSNNINKLYNVAPADRYISIVAYNNDNSVSSLYDMRYTF